MKNIHLFETKNAYDEAKNDLILPRVAYIKENKDVKYNPFNANGHDFVKIAGIKWATMNVGAKSITDYGLYFQWGDTQGYTADQVGTGENQKKFAWDYSDYNKELLKKYNTDGKTVLELEDDAVHAAWDGSWRMPTTEEFAKLRDAVNAVWTPNYQGSGINGLLCTAKDDTSKTLFFPACGDAYSGSMKDVGNYGYYWSSSIDSDRDDIPYCLNFGKGGEEWQNSNNHYYGFAVRGVLDEN